MNTVQPKFELGKIITSKTLERFKRSDPKFALWVDACLKRHASCDWGDICREGKRDNAVALKMKSGGRIISSYIDKFGIWIITEADRSVTTILFPEEY